VVFLLLITGVAKIATAFGDAKILGMHEPITWISFRILLPAVGVLELLVASACLLRNVSVPSKLGLIAWLSTSFLIYSPA